MRLNFLIFFLAVMANAGWAQRPGIWRVYRAADGLAQSACAGLTVDLQGRVLVTHMLSGRVSELDGYDIKTFPAPGQPAQIYQSPAGQFWAVDPRGLEEFRAGDWVIHPVPEIVAEFKRTPDGSETGVPLCPLRQGVVLFLLPDALMVFNGEALDQPRTEVIRKAAGAHVGAFSGMVPARDGGLWICGRDGVAKLPGPIRNLKADTAWAEYAAPDSEQFKNLHAPEPDGLGGLTALADSDGHQKSWVHFDGAHWSAQPAGSDKIQRAWLGPDETRWAATDDSLFQFDSARGDWVQDDEISTRSYRGVAVDADGTFWVATADGLYRCSAPSWGSPEVTRKIVASVHCLAEDGAGRMWFATGANLECVTTNGLQEYTFPEASGPPPAPRALYPMKDGSLIIDTGGEPIRFEPGNGLFTAIADSPSARLRPLGLLGGGELVVATGASDRSGVPGKLKVFDGSVFKDLRVPLPETASNAGFSAVLAGQNGDLWLGSSEGIWRRHDGTWKMFSTADRAAPVAPLYFAETIDGKVWCATSDQLWEFTGQNWSPLRPGFARINGLVRTHDGSLWVASDGGLYRWFRGSWVENGAEEGLPSVAVRALCEDQQGHLWAATARGLAVYHPEADSDPPLATIHTQTDSGQVVSAGGAITLTFSARDKWDNTPPNRLLYSYRLDDQDWSAFADVNGVSFMDLPAGKHAFQVRAADRNCNLSLPARLEFSMALPWYLETRLLLALTAGLALAVFFAGLAFNRHRQLLRSHALVEQKVADRTRELEIAHRELLHSQKMNALGTLAAGIAHDFNNILSIIKGSAQIIEDNPDNPEKIRTRLDRIKTVVEQGSGIVKAMLGFSRGSDQQAGPSDLNAVVGDTVKLLGDRFLREVEVRVEVAPDLGFVQAPRDFIQQILINFIFNAAEAGGESRQVVLATRALARLPGEMALAPAAAEAYAAVSVQDSGSGISAENLPRIFEPFFTTKAMSARRGTGLGLSMAYELARKMNAGLTVQTAVGRGSTFTLVLPVDRTHDRPLPASASPPAVMEKQP